MASRQLLHGAAALAGVAAAAVCFAIVDVTVAAQCSGGCGAATPPSAVGFAIGGSAALLVGAVLAVGWIVEAVARSRQHSPEDDAAAAREARPPRPAEPDEDD